MVPLLFAAAIAASSAFGQPAQADTQLRVLPAPSPFTPDVKAACAALGQLAVAPDGIPMLYKTTELPPGITEHAVWRTVGGCPVREIVYNGQAYYMGSSLPMLDREPLQGRIANRHY